MFLRALLCAFILWQCAAPRAFAETLSADELAALIRERDAKITSLSCAFTQTSTAPMFSAPLVSRGRMLFRAPDALRWEYLHPVEQGFILTKERITRWENGRQTRSSLPPDQDPLALFLGRQLLAWVGADTSAIGREYAVTLVRRNPLELSLAPRSSGAREVVRELRLRFNDQGVATFVHLTETGGGSTRLDFSDIRLNEALNPVEFE